MRCTQYTGWYLCSIRGSSINEVRYCSHSSSEINEPFIRRHDDWNRCFSGFSSAWNL